MTRILTRFRVPTEPGAVQIMGPQVFFVPVVGARARSGRKRSLVLIALRVVAGGVWCRWPWLWRFGKV